MKKNAPLAFRIPADLKKAIQAIAEKEARSLSQVCELLLRIGADSYEKEGAKYLQRSITRSKSSDKQG